MEANWAQMQIIMQHNDLLSNNNWTESLKPLKRCLLRAEIYWPHCITQIENIINGNKFAENFPFRGHLFSG